MKNKSKLDRITRLTAIATLISIILGIGVTVYQLYQTLGAARGTLNALKLEALQQVTGFLNTNATVRQKLVGYIRDQLPKDEALAKRLIEAGRSGEDLYYSKELELYRNGSAHYERLGAVIKLGYLDFDIVFDVIPFPKQFWEGTKKLRHLIGDNWDGKGNPLDDFLSDTRDLCHKYQDMRVKRSAEAKLKNPEVKPIENLICDDDTRSGSVLRAQSRTRSGASLK